MPALDRDRQGRNLAFFPDRFTRRLDGLHGDPRLQGEGSAEHRHQGDHEEPKASHR